MEYRIIKKETPTFYFIGVTTGSSSINKVFPLWMDVFGRPEVVLEGIDHKIHDDPENYRKTVAQIKNDPNSLGALVTTHKMNVYKAANDMFDYFDSYAQTTGELSCISKRAAETVNEEISFMGALKLRDIEAAQIRIIDSVRRLEAEGELDLGSANEQMHEEAHA